MPGRAKSPDPRAVSKLVSTHNKKAPSMIGRGL
jgi:hypothetical protein